MRKWICPSLLILFAGILRLYGISTEPLWLDEGYTLHYMSLPLSDTVNYILTHDANPPLYYILLKLWLMAAGNFVISEFILRVPSVLFGILTVWAIWNLTEENFGRRAAFVAGLIITVSHSAVWYSQEARMYSLLLFLTAINIKFFLRFLDNDKPASVSTMAGLVLTGTALLYTHNITALFLLCQGLFMCCIIIKRFSSRGMKNSRKWFLCQFIILLCYLPLLPFIAGQASLVGQTFWLAKPTGGDLVEIFNFLLIYRSGSCIAKTSVVCILFALMIFVFIKRKDKRITALFVLITGPIILSYLISLVITPVMLDRTLIYTLIPFSVLTGAFFQEGNISNRKFYVSVILLLLFIISVNLRSWYFENSRISKTDFRSAAGIVKKDSDEKTAIVFANAMSRVPFEYYFKNLKTTDKDIIRVSLPVEISEINGPVTGLEPPVTTKSLNRLKKETIDRKRIILVCNHEWYTDPKGLVKNYLDKHFSSIKKREVFDVKIYVYYRKISP